MRKTFFSIANEIDYQAARFLLSQKRESPCLIVFLFHTLSPDLSSLKKDLHFPHEGITLPQFRTFIAYFLELGYQFISPDEIPSLSPQKHYALITFDDGYFNNHLAVPILQEFKVPALFSLSTYNIERKRAFWWDVHYRIARKQGKSFRTILAEQNHLKKHSLQQIELELGSGDSTKLAPVSDLDRPFTWEEACDFAKETGVVIGNHTHSHPLLDHLSAQRIEQEINQTQEKLFTLTGQYPTAIAYPNGNFNQQVIQLSHAAGLKYGFTVETGKTPIPFPESQHLILARNQLSGERDIIKQCLQIRNSFSIKRQLKKLLA